MIPRILPAEVMINPAAHHEGLIRYRDDKRMLKMQDIEFPESGSEKSI
jgi:hypothetical protein